MDPLRHPPADRHRPRSPASFAVEVTSDGERTRVRLIGELDLATADDAAAGLLIAGMLDDQRVELDLVGLQFMDVRGLRVILAARQRLGDRLRLLPGPPGVQRLLELTGVADRMLLAG